MSVIANFLMESSFISKISKDIKIFIDILKDVPKKNKDLNILYLYTLIISQISKIEVKYLILIKFK